MDAIDDLPSDNFPTAGYDWTFLKRSSDLAEPFCWAYGLLRYRLFAPLDANKFDNSTSKVIEVAKRLFILATAAITVAFTGTPIYIASVALGISCKIFRILGVALQKNQFTHIKGGAAEKNLEEGKASVMTWNLCGHSGGLHYVDNGVIHWSSRLDQLVEKIKIENPDILVLQEIYDTRFAEKLIEKLSGEYAHFFTHLGINTWGAAGGCMIITKLACHSFTHTDFENNDPLVNQGFETLEIKASPNDAKPCLRIIGTHITKNDPKESMEQVAQIVDSLKSKIHTLPTVLAGNINNEADLSKYLYHSNRWEVTSTDGLTNQWINDPGKKHVMSDFVSLFKRNLPCGTSLPVTERKIRMLDCHLIEAFDKELNTKTALSNHHGIITLIDGLTK